MSRAGRSARWAGICAVSEQPRAARPRKPVVLRIFEKSLKVGFKLCISIPMAFIIVSQPILWQVFASGIWQALTAAGLRIGLQIEQPLVQTPEKRLESVPG